MKSSLHTFFFGTSLNDDKLLNFAWTLFRVHIGLSIAIHAGWPKVTGSSTPDWFIKQVGEIGFTFPSPEFWAMAATWGEFAGGLMLAAGFLTRFAALQLAFQFFVISFMWYEKPELFTGMYFQQLLLWCYVLAVFVGGGRYSVDRLIRSRKLGIGQVGSRISLTTVLFLVGMTLFAQNSPVRGKGRVIHRSYGIVNFDKIKLSDPDGEVSIEVGKPFAITTAADANLNDLLSVSAAGGTLEVKIINNKNNRRYIEDSHIRISIALPEISVLAHTGNSRVRLHRLFGRYFRFENIGNGDAIIGGSIDELEITKNGNGDIDASRVVAGRVKVTSYGNGNVKVQATSSLAVAGGGNGDVINIAAGKLLPGSQLSGNGKILTLPPTNN